MTRLILLLSFIFLTKTIKSEPKYPLLLETIKIIEEYSIYNYKYFGFEEILIDALSTKLDLPIVIKEKSKVKMEAIYLDKIFSIEKSQDKQNQLTHLLTVISPFLDSLIITNRLPITKDQYLSEILMTRLDSISEIFPNDFKGRNLYLKMSFRLYPNGQCKLLKMNANSLHDSLQISARDKVLTIEGRPTKILTKGIINNLLDSLTSISMTYENQGTIKNIRLSINDFKNPSIVTIPRKINVDFYVDSGYVIINNIKFLKYTFSDLAKLVRKNDQIKGIIIDLRDSDGGLVTNIVTFCEPFLKSNLLMFKINWKQETKEYKTYSEGKLSSLPIKILVNNKTSSGAELCAMILKLNAKDASVIGERTYGQGFVHLIRPYYDMNYQVRIRGGELILSNGKQLSGNGISPDIEYSGTEIIKFVKNRK